MATTFGQPLDITVPFEEHEDSPSETQSDDAFEAQRDLICAWDDRLTLATQLLGRSVDLGGADFTIFPPNGYPHNDSAKARRVQIAPFKPGVPDDESSDEESHYPQALVAVNYSTSGGPLFDQNDDKGREESITSAVEYLMAAPETLQFSDGTIIRDIEVPAKLLNTLVYQVTLFKLPAIRDSMLDNAGKVNSSGLTATTLNKVFGAETLLYEPGEFRRNVQPNGDVEWTADLKFSYRPDGWNKFWNFKADAFQAIETPDGTTKNPYPTADFVAMLGDD